MRRPTWENACKMGCELEDEIWEVFKSWEVSESCQRCTSQSFSFVSRIPNDTTFKDYSACPNGSQSKKLKTGSLWNFFLAVRKQHIFSLANSSSPHLLEYVWVRDAWTPCVKSADNGCEERTFPFGRARHATQGRVLCGLEQRLPKTLPTCASQGAMATVFHHQGDVATSRNP